MSFLERGSLSVEIAFHKISHETALGRQSLSAVVVVRDEQDSPRQGR